MGCIGVDFGTCAVRGVYRSNGEESAVRTRAGAYELPSAVSLSDSALRVGRVALERALMHPGQTAIDVRGYLRDGHGLNLPPGVSSEVALASLLLGEMRDLARLVGAATDADVVVGVPAGWNEEEAQRLRDACSAAGFGAARVVPEPICLVENIRVGDGATHHSAFLDLGGSSISAAVLRERGDEITVLSWVRIPYGGRDVDQRIGEVLLAGLGVESVPPGFEEMVRVACESLKRDLGEAQTSSYRLPCAIPGGPADADVLRLDRAGLMSALELYLDAMVRCLRMSLDSAGLPGADQPPVYLVGKMAGIPEVSQTIEEAFPSVSLLSLAPGAGIAGGASRLGTNMPNWSTCAATIMPAEPETREGAASSAVVPEQGPRVQDPFAGASTSAGADSIPAEPASAEVTPAYEPPTYQNAPSSIPPPIAPRVMHVQWTPSEGRVRTPSTPQEVLDLPLLRAPEPHELEPIAGPVLLRMLSRPDIAGVLHIEGGSSFMSMSVRAGYGYASTKEFSGFARAVMRPEATYRFVPEFPEGAHTRKRQSLVRIMVEGLRVLCRGFESDDISAVLGERVHRVPVIRKGRERLIRRLGLMSAEQRFVDYSLDGVRPISELVLNCGIGKNRGLQLLLILTACDALDFKAAEHHEVSIAQLLDERAISLRHKNYFEVLALHWSVLPDEIDEKYTKLRREVAVGSEAHEENPSAADEIRERLEAAYAVLSDGRQRAAYRVEAYPNVDYRMIDDFLEQQRKAVALHDEEAAKRVRESQLEIKESQVLQGRGRAKSEFDE